MGKIHIGSIGEAKPVTGHPAPWEARVEAAAVAFESRWMWMSLDRVDPGLAKRFEEQRALYQDALAHGSNRDITDHADAMVRGYAALVAAMEAAGEADDAYLIGYDAKSGLTIAISNKKDVIPRIREIHGHDVVMFSPDEIAALLAGTEGISQIVTAKRAWPGAEIVRVGETK